MMQEEIPYWMALAHLSEWSIQRKNELIVRCFEAKKTIIDLFQASTEDLQAHFGLIEVEIAPFMQAVTEVANYAFVAEDLLNQGYHMLPITSDLYPQSIKRHLKKAGSPPLIYAKGNLQVFGQTGYAFYAPPKPNEHSLAFAQTITNKGGKKGAALSTCTTKGIESSTLSLAMDSGYSVILGISQGILTFGAGFKKYYKAINQGKMVVVSPHPPQVRSNAVQAALSQRLKFGLASRIYIAETKRKPADWAKAIEQKQDRQQFFVRLPEPDEKNGNALLIQAGATAMDLTGNQVQPHS